MVLNDLFEKIVEWFFLGNFLGSEFCRNDFSKIKKNKRDG